MENFRAYILSVLTVSLLCGLTMSMIPREGPTKTALKLIAGLIITATVISPIVHISFENALSRITLSYDQADIAVKEGEEMAENSKEEIIKATLETYIVDRAKAMDAQIEVNVTLSENYTPESVQVSGQLSPYARNALMLFITTELGIAKEQQQWN